MIIKTPKNTRNYLLLRKGGIRLFNSYKRNKTLLSNFQNKKSTISTYNCSNKRSNLDLDIKEITKINKKNKKDKNILNAYTNDSNTSKKKFNISKYIPKLSEYKKHLFLNNIVSSEKNYLLEDYMKHKEIELFKNRNIRTVYDARKSFFNDNKINDNRTSYFYKEQLFDETKKFPLMIKDIQSNFILLKNKKYKKYKEYYLLSQIEAEKNNFRDFNEKLGVRNIFIKSDKLLNKNKTFMNNHLNFFNFNNYFKTISLQKGSFSQKKFFM